MKRYPKYKDSGIEWIGEIPEHWIVTCLKRICLKITDGSHFSPESKDIGFPYITVQDIKDNGIDFKNCKYISGEDYLSLKKGGCQPDKFDILLTKDGTIGKAVVIKQNRDFVILSSLGLITPNLSRIISDYLRYYLISGINIDQMFSFIRGSALTRLTINLIKQLHVVYPPLPEQQTIANYLGRKTHQIDTLIENKQKLISLLKEQRAAIINHAVTKGIRALSGWVRYRNIWR
jgi:type I restriction enzyme S subunit